MFYFEIYTDRGASSQHLENNHVNNLNNHPYLQNFKIGKNIFFINSKEIGQKERIPLRQCAGKLLTSNGQKAALFSKLVFI